jgi:uncharacterized membrane protein HdeD (DUF308 family)
MAAAVEADTYGYVPDDDYTDPPPFWALLTMGIIWILLSMLVLDFSYTSVTTIAVVIGVMLLLAGAAEIGEAFLAPGWKWAHAILGVFFLLGGIWAFVYPGQTFGALAILFGWYLLIKGTFDIVFAFMFRGVPLWWMGLIVGILEIALAFWTVGYVGRSAYMLILWVGLGALMRGIMTIITAFKVRHLTRRAA